METMLISATLAGSLGAAWMIQKGCDRQAQALLRAAK